MSNRKVYLILQSALCVLSVILLSASAVSIYREGRLRKAENPMEWIYTREAAAEKFKPVAPLLFGAIGMTAAGWILSVKDDNADAPVRDSEIARDLIVSRVVNPSAQMEEERRRQKKLFRCGWALFLLCMLPIGIYLLNGEHFPESDLEGMIASLAVRVIPWTVLGLSCLAASSVLQEKSILRETEAAKAQLRAEKEAAQAQLQAEKEAGVQPAPKPESKPETCAGNLKAIRTLQIAVAAAAVIFIMLGVMNGSAKAVLTKAANICTECIGLG